MIATWQAPLAGDKDANKASGAATSDELLISFDRARERRVLVLPAFFDEANKLRRLTVQIMRMLDELGIDSFLPDLPGCNESLEPLKEQTLESWRGAVKAAAQTFRATDIVSIRAGALLVPDALPAWQYAPQSGAKVLRAMIRARIIAAREAGRDETQEQLLKQARVDGLTLAGWPLSAAMLSQLEKAAPSPSDNHHVIAQADIPGAGLWLRAEPAYDQEQAEALAQIIAANEKVAP